MSYSGTQCGESWYFVAAPFENDTSWYRGKVMGVNGDELDLFFVNYGDSARCLIQAPSVVKVGDFVAAQLENDTSW